MKTAAAIVTDRGGRTCHAAIVSRELGVPCVVGTEHATDGLARRPGGHGLVRRGRDGRRLRGAARLRRAGAIDLAALPRPRTTGHDERRQSRTRPSRWPRCPTTASGSPAWSSSSPTSIGVHPLALLHPDRVDGRRRAGRDRRADRAATPATGRVTSSTGWPRAWPMIAAAFYPKDVIVRLSRLQDQRVRRAARRRRLRADGGEPDARLPRRLALLRPALPGGVRARVPGDEARPRRHGPDERQADGPVLPHRRARAAGWWS